MFMFTQEPGFEQVGQERWPGGFEGHTSTTSGGDQVLVTRTRAPKKRRLTHRNAQHDKSHGDNAKDSENLTAPLLGRPRIYESGKGIEQEILEHHL